MFLHDFVPEGPTASSLGLFYSFLFKIVFDHQISIF